ncbi:MAG TPA: hypothetical protein VNL91_03830 [Thermoanaerobaculia bacterium]|nr:hypothetical protein [Thermoanaerobaculia bacterium]
MTIPRFPAKRPAEETPVTIRCHGDLTDPDETVATIDTLTVVVVKGEDANPADILDGAAVPQGKDIIIPVHGGLAGVSYLIIPFYTTSLGRKLYAPAILPVRDL